jgi:hypothetical protein
LGCHWLKYLQKYKISIFLLCAGAAETPDGNQIILTLDDAKRNIENDRGPYYCDNISNDRRFKASPDWKGPGWYRMKSPAGLQLSEEPVLPYHCSTSGTGWLNGKQSLSSTDRLATYYCVIIPEPSINVFLTKVRPNIMKSK